MKKSTVVLALLTIVAPLALIARGGGGRSFGGGGRGASFRGGGYGRSMSAGRSMRGAGTRNIGRATPRGKGPGHVSPGGRGASHVGPGGRGAGHDGRGPGRDGRGGGRGPGHDGRGGGHDGRGHHGHDHGHHHDWNRGWAGNVVVGVPWYANMWPWLLGAGVLGYAGYAGYYAGYYGPNGYPGYAPAPSVSVEQNVNYPERAGSSGEQPEKGEPKLDLLAAQRARELGQPTGTASALATQPVDVD